MAVLRQATQARACELIVPRIVVEETVNCYREKLEEKQHAALSAHRTLDALLPEADRLEPLRLDVERSVERFQTWLDSQLSDLNVYRPAYTDFPHERIVERALSRRRPFREKDVGYRDTLLWETVLFKVADESAELLFVTDNKRDFCAEKADDTLHPDLLDDLRHLGLSESAVRIYPNLRKLVAEALEPLILQKSIAVSSLTILERSSSFLQVFLDEYEPAYTIEIAKKLNETRVPGWSAHLQGVVSGVELRSLIRMEVEEAYEIEGGAVINLEAKAVGEFAVTFESSLNEVSDPDWSDGRLQEDDVGARSNDETPKITLIPFRVRLEFVNDADSSRPKVVGFSVDVYETLFLIANLTQDTPEDAAAQTKEGQARHLLAGLLEWHRRESRVSWGDYFRLCDLPIAEYEQEPSALSGLSFLGTSANNEPSSVCRYGFPPQDYDMSVGDEAFESGGRPIGRIESIDPVSRTVEIFPRKGCRHLRPNHVFVRRFISHGEKPAALLDLGRWVASHGIDAPGDHRVARDLILRSAPRFKSSDFELPVPRGSHRVEQAVALVKNLEEGVLPIQGPPGTGIYFTGASMVLALVKAGKSVGIASVAHRVIDDFFGFCGSHAKDEGIKGLKYLRGGSAPSSLGSIDVVKGHRRVRDLFDQGEHSVIGGTPWFWARSDVRPTVDVLFIVEAGEMPLADAVAIAGAAKRMVLLGDPQQEFGVLRLSDKYTSVFAHMLAGRRTLPDSAGLLLEETWRMHPALTEFISREFYDGRLRSKAITKLLGVIEGEPFPEAGLVYVRAEREATLLRVVASIVARLTDGTARWRDGSGKQRLLTLADLMVVTPSMAEIGYIARNLEGIRVGTVTQFLGQQAPVVIAIWSRTGTRRASPNHLNVALSRAQALSILVANAEFVGAASEKERESNDLLVRYVEAAHVIDSSVL